MSTTSSRFYRWAQLIREFEQADALIANPDSPLYIWVFRPSIKVCCSLLLFVLTFIVGVSTPKALYVANAGAETPFLDYRLFVLYLIGSYEFLGGNFVYFPGLKEIDNATVLFILRDIKYAVGLLILLGNMSVIVWIGARSTKVSLPFSQSLKIAGYGMGITPLFVACLGLIAVAFDETMSWMFYSYATEHTRCLIQFMVTSVTILVGGIYLIYATFIVPVSVVSPGSSRFSLFLGWLAGWLLVMSINFGIMKYLDYLMPELAFRIGVNFPPYP